VARDIPEGWILAAEFDIRKPGASKKEAPSGIYRVVLRACEQGTIRAYKDASRWVVNKDDVEALRSNIDATQRKAALMDDPSNELGLHLIEIRRQVEILSGLAVRAMGSLVAAINEVRNAVQDLKPTGGTEPKQDIGPY
jgi:hypothetical protein